MNVTVENLAPCKKLVRVELDTQVVDQAFDDMLKDFQRQVSLPGFRPGKAPRDMVAKRFEKDIQDEVRKKLIPKAYRDMVEQQKLTVVGPPDLEEVQFGRGQALHLAITLETVPEFEMPSYNGLRAKRETSQVTDDDVTKALNLLRERQVKFETADRPLQAGDIAVVNYQGTVDGKPITDLAPVAKGLTMQTGFWIHTEGQAFIPGFADQLLGAKAGERRTVTVDFPADFVTPQIAGLKGVFEVEVTEIKSKSLPGLDDEFAKSYGAENFEKLRTGVRTDLENELSFKQSRSLRNQLVNELLAQVNFDLPDYSLKQEIRSVVFNIVSENQKRGVPKEAIDHEKDAIFSAASNTAKVRVKANFILRKIAEIEQIKVSQQELGERIHRLAGMYEIPVEKYVDDLKKRDGVMEIHDQLLFEKALNFVEQHAVIEDVPPGTLGAQA